MKQIILFINLILFFLLLPMSNVLSQEKDAEKNVTVAEPKEEKDKQKSLNVNIDAKMLYGQYNSIVSSNSIAQNFNDFSYQLNADLKRSNDYGFKNSSYYESEIGFTGKADVTETWKFMPQLEVNNESHGMFKNLTFNREEKDKVIVLLKNEYKPTPSRLDFNIGGANYVHRLFSAQATGVKSSTFYKVNGELGWEYVWSASNKVRLGSKFAQYDYPNKSNNDTYVNSELIGSFKITEYIMIGLGPIYNWNRDYGHFPSGKINISTVSLTNLSVDLSYVYDLIPFKPEDFYFQQKYILPNYRMPPGRVHHADLKIGLEFKKTSKDNFYISSIKIKGLGAFEKNDKFYNYFSYFNNVLMAQTISVMFCKARGDIILDFSIFDSKLSLGVNYEYYYYYANKYVTYRPAHSAGALINYKKNRWELELNNIYRGKIYTDPYYKRTLGQSILSSFSVQFKVFDTFFLYAKIDNIFDYRYSYRKGYPEQGRTILGGLRIIL